jgi:alkylation response protein AidB-like acyl-CoA dehydrogenase
MSAVLGAARTLKPAIRARASEIERARRLPADLAAQLASAGLFRLGIPREIGGLEVDPATLFGVIETIGEADASVGWCVMIGATSGVTAAYLPTAVAREIFGALDAIAGGVFAPMGRAVEDGDSYVLNGKWQWASGSVNCSWLMGGAAIVADGEPRRLPNGALDSRMLLFPAADAELIDSWHVSGLCGTGSGEMQVADLRVPKNRSVSLMTDKPVATGALYAFPVFGLLALGIAAVLLGNAQGAVAELVELAGGKKPLGSTRALAERATAQAVLADNVAKLRAARAFYYDAVDKAWSKAKTNGAIAIEERAALRLAATHAARTSAAVVREMYELGGGSSLFLDSPLQRRFRDAYAGTQHMMIAPQTYELTGRFLMGLPTDASFL